jgi:Zn-dependent proteases
VTIGRLFGVRITLNAFFLALLALSSLAGLFWRAVLFFSIVFLHEMAHVAAARRYGLRVSEVELLPFGGVARIDDLLEADPSVEAKVALCGPLANALLVAFVLVGARLGLVPDELTPILVQANAVIGGFNLVPALPLDGGRVYRAMLAQRIGFRPATQRAAAVGRAFAAMMAVLGAVVLPENPVNATWIVVGIFVYFAARREEEQAGFVLVRYLARRRNQLRAGGRWRAHQLVASEETPVKELVGRMVPQRYHIVWVLDREGRLSGIATELDLIDALFHQGSDTAVGALARPVGARDPGA